jgi:uncharacterized protein DUF5916/cellulose/xylan binding protein with CBM9 domain
MIRRSATLCATVYLRARVAAAVSILIAVNPATGAAQQRRPRVSTRTAASTTSAININYDTARLERRLMAVRAAGSISVDGVLDEPGWADAPMAHNFIQNDPREGEPATYDTEVRILYDDDALYFGVFAKDDDPARLIVNDLKKDYSTGNSDGFTIILDTFHDERNGYQFATNPAGAKWDSQTSNEGRENNPNWDGIWDVATNIAETGWYAEIRIPFRTLKFDPAELQTWGVNFERKLRRFNEDSYWSPLPRIYNLDRVSMAGTVEGLRGLRPGKNLRIKPYGASSSNTVAGTATKGEFDGGLDVKYGVTTGLVWDFTANTDFSQVEADEQQVNLTRFSLFFPEKRDFFLENSGIFQFGTAGGNFNNRTDMRLFFSRRVGLSDDGEVIPILAGTRLTGRQGAYSLGVLNIQQREQGAHAGANFTALRLRRDILSQSDIGAVLLNKDENGAHFNRVAGVDANFRFGYLMLNGYVAKAFSPDTTGTPSTGNEYTTRTGFRYEDREWRFEGGYSGVGNRFNDEMGFVPRLGVHYFDGWMGRRLRPLATSSWLRQMQPHMEYDVFTRQDTGRLETRTIGYHYNFNLEDGSNVEIGVNSLAENVPAPFTISNATGTLVNAGRYDYNEYFAFWRTNESAPIAVNGRYNIGPFYGGYRRTYTIGPSVRLNENLNAAVNLQLNDITLPTGAFVAKLVTTRVNYNFNTRMFFNALVQYNSDNHQWTSNLRFNIIHRPLSDFFLVYNERRDERTGQMLTRAVIAKLTYMMAF